MTRFILATVGTSVAVAVLVASGPVRVSETSMIDESPSLPAPVAGGQVQLIGFTSHTFDGTRGLLRYSLACQAEFPGTRMCMSDEIIRTFHVPEAPGTTYAWIDPSFRPVANQLLDASGLIDEAAVGESGMSCLGWLAGAGYTGLALKFDDGDSDHGAFVLVGCGSEAAIACCGPMS